MSEAHEYGRAYTPADPADDPDVANLEQTIDFMYPHLADDPGRRYRYVDRTFLVEDSQGQAGGLVTRREAHVTNCPPPRDAA